MQPDALFSINQHLSFLKAESACYCGLSFSSFNPTPQNIFKKIIQDDADESEG